MIIAQCSWIRPVTAEWPEFERLWVTYCECSGGRVGAYLHLVRENTMLRRVWALLRILVQRRGQQGLVRAYGELSGWENKGPVWTY